MTKILNTIALAIILACLLFGNKCKNDKLIAITDTIIDTITNEVDIGEPYIIYTDTGSLRIDSILMHVDTLAILRDYFAIRYYRDTLVNDTSLLIVVTDTVTENKLSGMGASYTYYNKSVTAHHILKPKNMVFTGILTGNTFNRFSLGPSVTLLTKHDKMYNVNYDILNGNIHFTALWKLSFKKHGINNY